MDDTPVFSRAGFFGKCDAEIKTRITSETKFKLQALAHSLGMTESEFVRELIDYRVYGGEHVQRVAQARVMAVAGVLAIGGNNQGTNGGHDL